MQNKGKSRRIYIVLGIVLFITIVFMAMALPNNNINKSILIEAGGELPEAGDFFKNHIDNAEYVTDMTGINSNEPGIYDVEIKSGKKTYSLKLEIKDTIAPVAEIVNVDLYESRTVEPQEYLRSIKDATNVKLAYKVEPDYKKTGNQEVVLLLEDTSGNKTEYKSILRISKVKEIAEIDISEGKLDAGTFLKDQKDLNISKVTDTSFPTTLGIFPVKITVGDVVYDSSVKIIDRIAPIGIAVDRKFWTVDKISAMDFVEDVIDATPVTARFTEEPDFTNIGDQTVKITLADQEGNETQFEAVLTLEADTEPPKIY